ncbi:MAG: hypothetical protein HUJ65_06130, partial [Oscillospiraceae bacterium]|nr:hypothetical protein [Oscillospiraceae bacterium]
MIFNRKKKQQADESSESRVETGETLPRDSSAELDSVQIETYEVTSSGSFGDVSELFAADEVTTSKTFEDDVFDFEFASASEAESAKLANDADEVEDSAESHSETEPVEEQEPEGQSEEAADSQEEAAEESESGGASEHGREQDVSEEPVSDPSSDQLESEAGSGNESEEFDEEFDEEETEEDAPEYEEEYSGFEAPPVMDMTASPAYQEWSEPEDDDEASIPANADDTAMSVDAEDVSASTEIDETPVQNGTDEFSAPAGEGAFYEPVYAGDFPAPRQFAVVPDEEPVSVESFDQVDALPTGQEEAFEPEGEEFLEDSEAIVDDNQTDYYRYGDKMHNVRQDVVLEKSRSKGAKHARAKHGKPTRKEERRAREAAMPEFQRKSRKTRILLIVVAVLLTIVLGLLITQIVYLAKIKDNTAVQQTDATQVEAKQVNEANGGDETAHAAKTKATT